jgi:hypothetical protein
MNRPLLIAAFLLLAASIPLSAQRGGGHASFGGHGGMAGHASFGGHAGGGRSFSGARSSPGFAGRNSVRGSFHRSFASNRSFNRSFSSRGFHNRDDRFRRHGFRNNCYGYACRGYGYPWWYAGAYDPYWWDSDSSYDQDEQNNAALAAEMNAQSLDEQRMRQQEDQDVYASSAPPGPHQFSPHQSSQQQEDRTQAAPTTVLVFRNQHQQEVQNYAIVGQTLWNFSPPHTQKIPLSDLDLVATAKANDERGVDFRVPETHEGQ